MKKILAILLSAMLIFSAAFAASTETAAEAPVLMEGVVIEVSDGGYLIENEELGEVMVLTGEETFIETSGDIAVGDYLYIDYSGMMTRSLPPQITASVVRMHKLEGSVTEVFAEENGVMLLTETHGDVYVRLPAEWAGQELSAEALTVYFDGVMTMSLPPQVSAGLAIPGYAIQGVVSEIADGHLMLGEGMEAVQVNAGAGLIPEDLKVGDVVRIIYNGMMTRSIPAQINAGEIIQISR